MSCSSAKKSFVLILWSRLLFQMSQAAGEEDRDDLLHFLGMNIVETAKKQKVESESFGGSTEPNHHSSSVKMYHLESPGCASILQGEKN